MKVYLAARYGRYPEMQHVAARLEELGHQVTSRWIEGNHEAPDDGLNCPPDGFARLLAADDLDDLRAADCCVSFTEPVPGVTRGGRHVEFGVALERGLRLIVVGRREHVFHCVDEVECYATTDELLAALGSAVTAPAGSGS